MVDLAIHRNDVDAAFAAFAALAVRNHLEAGTVQCVEHRTVLRHDEFDVGILQPHAEFGRRLQPAGADGFIAQIGRRAAQIVPGTPRRLQHPHRSAHDSDGIVRQSAEGGFEVEPRANCSARADSIWQRFIQLAASL